MSDYEKEKLPKHEKQGLTSDEFKKVLTATQKSVERRGTEFYSWKDAPEINDDGKITQGSNGREITIQEALGVSKAKTDSAYSERFVMSMGLVAGLINNVYSVRLVQFQDEPDVPFDASGWTVMVVETMPMFHIAPDDLDAEEVGDLVEVLPDNQAPDVSWKKTNKIGEFNALLKGSVEHDLDLVSIAQQSLVPPQT